MEFEEDYAQGSNPVSSIKAIVDGYPPSVGIFREILQNSDDAGAKKQVSNLSSGSRTGRRCRCRCNRCLCLIEGSIRTPSCIDLV